MAANITDYMALQRAKNKTDKNFDDMLAKLDKAKAEIDKMNENAWKGASANVFNDVFNDIKAKLDNERNEFNNEMDKKLTLWHNEFNETEKQQIQAAQNM